jgi:hypothetical protein
MTTRKELNAILDNCDTCAGGDDASYYEHFTSCSQCIEYAEKAEQFETALVTLGEIAAEPYDVAKIRFLGELKGIIDKPAKVGRQEMSNLLDCVAELPDPTRDKLCKVRTDLIMEMPKNHRDRLMGVLQEIMRGWTSERKLMEMRSVVKATEDYQFLQKMMVRRKFNEMMN